VVEDRLALTGAQVVEGGQHVAQLQSRVELLGREQVAEEGLEPFEGRGLEGHGAKHLLGGHEDVDAEHVPARGAVEDQVVQGPVPGDQGLGQQGLAPVPGLLAEPVFQLHQLDAAGEQPEVVPGRADHLALGEPPSLFVITGDEFVEAEWMMDTKEFGRLALGVAVHQKHSAAHPGQRVGQIHGRGGLSDTALGHGHGDFAHGIETEPERGGNRMSSVFFYSSKSLFFSTMGRPHWQPPAFAFRPPSMVRGGIRAVPGRERTAGQPSPRGGRCSRTDDANAIFSNH